MPSLQNVLPTIIVGANVAVPVTLDTDSVGLLTESGFYQNIPVPLSPSYATDTSSNLTAGGTYVRGYIDLYYYNFITIAVGADQPLNVVLQVSDNTSTWYQLGTVISCGAGSVTLIPAGHLGINTGGLPNPTRYFRYIITNVGTATTTWLRAFSTYGLL